MRTLAKRVVRRLLRPFKRVVRPLVRRYDNHMAHVMRTVLHHEPGSNVPTFWHLISVRDDVIAHIDATRGSTTTSSANNEEMELLVDSLIREIVRLQHQIDSMRTQLESMAVSFDSEQNTTTVRENVPKAA